MRICEHTYKLHPHSASSYRNSTRSERFGYVRIECATCVYMFATRAMQGGEDA